MIGNIGPGAGEASRLAVGSTILGGMIISTFFTLYVTPSMYLALAKNTKRIDAVDLELKKELSIHGKGMTAAFPSETKFSQISDQALAVFDFINIMVYDYTGSWNPSEPGQHSSYNHAERGINYWKNIVGIAGEKLTLGVPFYGYNFLNSTTVESFTYGSMVASNTSNSERDQVGNKYYNGRPTIASKVKLAAQNLSGIMIWELGQDSFTEYSLLQTIHKTLSLIHI